MGNKFFIVVTILAFFAFVNAGSVAKRSADPSEITNIYEREKRDEPSNSSEEPEVDSKEDDDDCGNNSGPDDNRERRSAPMGELIVRRRRQSSNQSNELAEKNTMLSIIGQILGMFPFLGGPLKRLFTAIDHFVAMFTSRI